MEEAKEKKAEEPKIVAVCASCRNHQHNPTIEFNFAEVKVYWLCQLCKTMNIMDLSKPLASPYPRTRRM